MTTTGFFTGGGGLCRISIEDVVGLRKLGRASPSIEMEPLREGETIAAAALASVSLLHGVMDRRVNMLATSAADRWEEEEDCGPEAVFEDVLVAFGEVSAASFLAGVRANMPAE